jgi:alpha-tubulin suppressor-like RCC1 family protein
MTACLLAAGVVAGVALPATGASAASTQQVFTWGASTNGTPVSISQPIALPSPAAASVRQLVAGSINGAAVLTDGTVQDWGSNVWGQLGDGTPEQWRDTPAPVPGLSGVTQLAIGGNFAFYIFDCCGPFMLAVGAGGSVWAWGDNESDELGTVAFKHQPVPIQVNGLAGIVQVAAGGDHALALDRRGFVWAWGDDEYGELGDGSAGGTSYPKQVPGLSGIVAVAAGDSTSYAVRGDGTLFAWGSAGLGMLGNGSDSGFVATPTPVAGLTGVTQVSVGEADVLAIADTASASTTGGSALVGGPNPRTVWAWGANYNGETGNGTVNVRQLRPVQLPLTGATQVAEGQEASAAILPGGRLMVWGDNTYLQLGLGPDVTSSAVPVQNPYLTGVSQVTMGCGGQAIGTSTLIPVPDVRGDDQATAAAAVKAAGLTLGPVSTVGVCASPGQVVSQSPAGGALVLPGTAVSLTVGVLKLCPPG